jgi:hypothetical protein|tara:strand:+ start:204 stop:314 length:111 start_codon:yes stop_codon:yes gene_type:complete
MVTLVALQADQVPVVQTQELEAEEDTDLLIDQEDLE